MPVKGYAAKSPRGQLEALDFDPGPLGSDEVEVRVTHCGVCHSDIAMIDNDWGMTTYPLVPGHEAVGAVSALGANVADHLRVGARVGVGWQCGSCQRCEWCAAGKEHLCAGTQGTIIGHRGAWAESVRCHWKFAVPLPDELRSERVGPLMCAGTTVFTPMLHYGVTSGTRAAVVGVGGLGHLAVQFLAKMGCEVTAISSTHSKDADTKKLGASRFIATKGTDELKRAANSFDFIISTVSADVPWGEYVAALRPQGRLVICGIPESDVRFPAFPLLAEKSVSGGQAGAPSDTLKMLEFAARTGVVPMVEEFKLSDVNAAVEHVRGGKARFRAVLVV